MPAGVELATAYVSMALEGSTLKRQVAAELNATGPAAARAGKQAGGRFSGAFKSSFKGAAAGVIAAFGAAEVIGFFKDTVSEASNLGESINAVRVSYGKAAEDVLLLGKNAAKSFGLSKSEFNGFAVQFQSFSKTIAGADGDVSKTFASIIGRATDFASVMNLDVAQAAQLFQSGLAGESEPLRKFGIDLSAAAVEAFAYSNGIAKSGEDLTEAQKVQARYGLLLQKTSKFQGDFANTSGGLANQQRILSSQWKDFKATLGAKLLPVMTQVVKFFNSTAIPALSNFGTTVKQVGGFLDEHKTKFAVAGGILTAIFLPAILSTTAGLLISTAAMIANGVAAVATTAGWIAYVAIANIARTATVLWTGVQWLLNAAMTANPIGLVVIAIAALVAGIIWVATKTTWFQTIWTVAWGAIKKAAVAVWTWIKKNWPLLLAILTGPIGLAVLAIVKNWDKIKAGATAVKNWISTKFNELISFFRGLPGKVSSAVSGLFDGIKSAFRAAINWVIDKWNGLEFGIPAFSFGGKSFDGFTVGTPNIDRLAAGGIVTRPTLAWVGEGRESEAVMPLSKLNALLNGGANAGQPREFYLKSGALTIRDGKAWVEGIIEEAAFEAATA